MIKGLVSSIQRASFHDGEGIRTTVFLKGCPLSCAWCHNPESISFEKEELFYPEKCIGCKKCAEGCYSGARVICGTEMTAEQVFDERKADICYYGESGGVTLSGGEPLAQPQFARAIIDICKKNGVSVGVETSLIYFDEEIFRSLDFVIADFKIFDSDIHEKYTGVRNEKIKENFIALSSLGVKIIARTPVIPEIEQGIDKISQFLSELPSVKAYELLPYHTLGLAKAQALGKTQRQFSAPSKEFMEEMRKYAFTRR